MMIDNKDGQSGANCSDKLRVNFGPKILPSPLFRATLPMRSFMKHLTRARVSASPTDQHGSITSGCPVGSSSAILPNLKILIPIGILAVEEDASAYRRPPFHDRVQYRRLRVLYERLFNLQLVSL